MRGGCALLASAASRKALAIARSLRTALKLRVVGVFHTRHPYLFSRYFDRRLLVKAPRPSELWARAVLRAAEELSCSVAVPVDFADVMALARLRGEFESRGVALAAPPYEAALAASDKASLPELLGGVARVPKQVVVKRGGGLDFVADLEPPLVVKGLGDASNPTYHLSRSSAAEEARRRGECLVQEFVPGVARGYYAVAHEGVPLLEFTHERLVERDPTGGASMAARGPVLDPLLYRVGRRIVEKLRWTGPLMVELKYDLESGQYYVVELNPKFWGSLDLPVSLGYHFPAVLVVAVTEGPEKARQLSQRLRAQRGSFAWVLDGFRYLAKVPSAWTELARFSFRGGSDVDPADPGRVAAQLWVALSRLPAEKKRWRGYLEGASRELGEWARIFLDAASKNERLLLLDLDGVIVDLRVNWALVYRELRVRGLLREGEYFASALARLWRSDRARYAEASSLAASHEVQALERSAYLLGREVLEELSEHYEVYVVTKQAHSAAVEALRRLGVLGKVRGVVSRDSGYGPSKRSMVAAILSGRPGAGAFMVDDRLDNLVEALRAGAVPVLAAGKPYQAARSARLGIPAAPPRRVAELLLKVAR